MSPPRWMRRLLGRLIPGADRRWLLEELDDLWRERAEREGRRAADRWYRRQLPSFAIRLLRERARRTGAALTDPTTLREVVAVDRIWADLRYALRRLGRTPAFTAVAVLTLALGIGANTAMFSVVNAVLLQEQPYAEPDRTVEIYTSEADGFPHSTTSFPDLRDLRDREGVFDGVVGTRTFLARLDRDGRPELAFGELVSWDFFQTLGIRMTLGRAFAPEEGSTPGGAPVVILGHHTWVEEFGADPTVLGRTVVLNGHPFQVVGVVTEEYAGNIPVLFTGFYAPMMMTNELMGSTMGDQLERRGSRSMFVKGVLAEGVTVEQANAELQAFSTALGERYPDSNELRIMSALPSGDVALHPMVDRFLTPVAGLMLAVVGIVLLIACTNLASFLLARAEDRRKEIALRLALGAGRGRLVRQLLVETLLLAGLGGMAGWLVAQWALRLALAFQPPVPVPVDFVLELDGRVLAFTAAVSVLAGLFFGLAPALQSTRPDVAPTLKDEAGGAGKPGRFSLRGAMVVTQVAFSFLLLIGAGLFVRSLQKAQRIDPGFDTGPGAVIWPMADISGYDESEEVLALNRQLEAELLAHPLIDRVAMADRLPLGSEIRTEDFLLPDLPSEAPDGSWEIDNATVMPGYFEAMGVEIVRGRSLVEADVEGDRVAVVSQAFVDRFYPGQDVVGRTIRSGREIRIVGVARDAKVRTLGESPRPYIYESVNAEMAFGVQFVVRGDAEPADLLAAALEVVDRVDPDLVLFEAKTMDQHLALMLFPPRMAAVMLSIFGGLALLLSAIGIYGAVSHTVAKRTREMGIRMSLGASARDVIAMAVGGGMRLVLVGAGLGVVLAAGLTWMISGFLYGISTTDLATFVTIPLILVAVALTAAFVPARRAARVDPVRALRAE